MFRTFQNPRPPIYPHIVRWSGLLRNALLCTLLSFAAFGQIAGPQSSARQKPSTAAIIFDGPAEPNGKGYLHALFLENLLGHFELRAKLTPVAQYRPGQLASHNAAFFIGADADSEVPEALLADARAYSQPFCWMGRHIGSLVNAPEWQAKYGFRVEEYTERLGFDHVYYKNTILPKKDPSLGMLTVTDPEEVEVISTAVNHKNVWRPYVVRQKRLWHFADLPLSEMEEGGSYLVLCDLLHDILEIEHKADSPALVRIEDVTINEDPSALRRIADLLGGLRIPFQISIIPVFRDPALGREVRMSDRRSFTDAVRYMVSRGGSAVMHGITHQYRGRTAEDYEFWDGAGDRPIVGDSAESLMRKLQLGVSECFKSGIFPVAFETPGYAASETDYGALGRVFRLFHERTMAAPKLDSRQFFPYPLIDRFGRFVIPENLGCIPRNKPDTRQILDRARNLRVVRDGIASFYFHPFQDDALLEQLVTGISGLGYRFASIRDFGGDLDFLGRYVVRTTSGNVRLSPQNEFWRLRAFNASGSMVRNEVSGSKVSGPIDIFIDVPRGGWVALDCLKSIPQEKGSRDWRAELKQRSERFFPAEGDNAAPPLPERLPSGKQAWILWLDNAPSGDLRNQQSYRSVLNTVGYRTLAIGVSGFSATPSQPCSLLVVPQGAGLRLTDKQKKEVLRYLAAGGSVVADGRQDWLSKLGVRWTGPPIAVSGVSDVLFPETDLRWNPPERVERFAASRHIRELMVDKESGQVLAFAGEHGAGRFLYLAVPFDTHTASGVSHYPYFATYLDETFGCRHAAGRARLEAYFDPSFRMRADLDRLAAGWSKSGIRTVYAAAWIFSNSYSYDYANLIAACHRHGILVYAWFVFPAVTQKFWDDHPGWRERTATGADSRAGWRYAMNFESAACFRAAMDWMNDLLRSHEWDGVNVTELNFDADFNDYLRADKFVPMNREVRAAFKRKAGFDPALIFSPASDRFHKKDSGSLQKFLSFREDVVVEWHRRVLSELEPLRRKRGWEIIITALDSLHSDYVRPALGVDSRRIVELMKQYDFTLQVEDPAEHWNRTPDRYVAFAQGYLKVVPDPKRLMFDVNVMPDRDVSATTLPSSTATGIELARTALAAALVSGRVAIYSEHTVPAQDWPLLRAALSNLDNCARSGLE